MKFLKDGSLTLNVTKVQRVKGKCNLSYFSEGKCFCKELCKEMIVFGFVRQIAWSSFTSFT